MSICVVVNYRNEQYSCMVGDDKNIELIIKDYITYKNYIPTSLNFLNFLNMKRNDNSPTWIIGHDRDCNNKRGIDIFIKQNTIDILSINQKDKQIEITNQKNPEFIEFINRRFLLKHICNKYNLPKDLHQHLMGFF